MAIFKGAGVAIVTPMKNNEEVNYDKLEELINQQIDGGTDAIVIAGTTGESATLTMEEHRDVIKAAIEFTKHRVPVVAGTGSNCTRTAIQLSQEAEEAGADGLLAVTPYYNKATQGGLIRYYTEIAEAVKLPIIMYNVPGRTGCNIMPETAATLFKTVENIVGIKEATGSLAQASRLMYLTDGKIDLYSGEDGIVVQGLSNCLVKFSKCCTPVPGDDIVGFITRGYGVSVHRADCPNADPARRKPSEAGRWIKVSWGSDTRESYRTTLEVVAKDRLNLIVDISTVLSSTKTHVSSMNARSTPDGFALLSLDIDVPDSEQLRTVMRRLEQISGVMRVTRPAG